VLAALVDVAQSVGYPLLFALIAVETMGIPLPGESALITAAIVAGRGKLDITTVIAVAAAAAIVGDNIGFAIGRRFGRRVLLSDRGPFPRHRRRLIEMGEPFFERHGPKAVFLGRWVAGLRITAAWLAGASRMNWPIFLVYNALGGIAWAASIGLAAYFAGHTAEKIVTTLGWAGAAVVVVAGAAIYVAAKRRGARGARSDDT
jgi:membrane-associated protein